ncbi:flagellar basal body P-ring formation chaperone FlgA [Aestuariivirga litoralis]|uniref:flagellar basal body P-ring formation chaperone FlgA n=1 Tax=Aestuariivirga litoralis TaxID=2650924 RepID=UPI0018C5FB36|nr:flagellar basal body P-ring formation chaperone FlgA [Aestuariivirga litoralis]MBG1233195.1 flagellar basal body P-ring formation protein FlgA [Aestuariivirga litoralis]
MLRKLAYSSMAAILVLAAVPAQAEILSMPVPAHVVQAGQELSEGDFYVKDFEVNAVGKANFATDMGQVARMMTTKVLAPGRPIPLSVLATPPAVRKGKTTVVHFVTDGIDIQGTLMPMQDGSIGELIPARNSGSGVTVNALVMADGTLSVSEK